MNRPDNDDGAWFAPKRFGYGSGLPIRWQGWAVLAVYAAFVAPVAMIEHLHGRGLRVVALILLGLATIALVWISRTRTRGGWKWRWGGD